MIGPSAVIRNQLANRGSQNQKMSRWRMGLWQLHQRGVDSGALPVQYKR
jgi:hypothetical protein